MTAAVARFASALRAGRWARRALHLYLPAVILIGIVLGAWEWAAQAGHLPITLPAPSEIWDELIESSDTLWYHTWPTIVSALRGYLLAVAMAVGLALIVVVAPRTANAVNGTAVVVSSIPLLALTPVLVLWLGRGEAVRTGIAAIASFFPILVGCVQGFRATDAQAEELFDVLSARRWQRFVRLSLPSSLPYVFAGLKAAAAAAVLGAIIAEWTGGGGNRGLGQMMVNALFAFNVAQTWLTILTAALLAVGFYLVIAVLERVVVRWEHDVVDVGT